MADSLREPPRGTSGPRHLVPAPPRLPAAVAYAVALALPLVAFALQLGFQRLFEKTPFLLLSLAPPAVAWAAGGGPAVAAVVLSSVLGGLFLSRLGAVDPATGVLFSALPLLPASAVGGALGWLARLGFEERERSAHALRESENLYRTLFDLSPYGVALMAPDGRFVAFNASAHRDLGYTREEFTRLTVADLEAEEDPAEIGATSTPSRPAAPMTSPATTGRGAGRCGNVASRSAP